MPEQTDPFARLAKAYEQQMTRHEQAIQLNPIGCLIAASRSASEKKQKRSNDLRAKCALA